MNIDLHNPYAWVSHGGVYWIPQDMIRDCLWLLPEGWTFDRASTDARTVVFRVLYQWGLKMDQDG